MAGFGFFPLAAQTPTLSGYRPAQVRIAEFEETVLCSLSTWSIGDYVEHWRAASEASLRGVGPVLFCTDLDTRQALAFLATPMADAVEFIEVAFRRPDLEIDGPRLKMRKPILDTSGDISRWRVGRDEIRRFVDQRSS